MKAEKWRIIYWTGAICAFCGYCIEDFAVILGGLLILLVGVIQGMTRP